MKLSIQISDVDEKELLVVINKTKNNPIILIL